MPMPDQLECTVPATDFSRKRQGTMEKLLGRLFVQNTAGPVVNVASLLDSRFSGAMY